jgi:hypothetical protein
MQKEETKTWWHGVLTVGVCAGKAAGSGSSSDDKYRQRDNSSSNNKA